MKIECSIDDILADKNINEAIEYLQSKKNSCGDDDVWLHDLEEYWKLNKENICAEIRNGNYKPQIVHEKIIVMANGKHRKISLMSSIDRLLLRAILQVLREPCDSLYSEYSFAYRCGKGTDEAVKCAANYIEQGREYVVEIDIKDFFDNISHAILLKLLKELIKDMSLYSLLEKYIVCMVEYDYQIQKKERGILQGSPLSPLLSNLYMNSFDCWLEKKGIFSVYARKYLGYRFEKAGTSVLVKRCTKKELTVFSKWHKNAIEKIEQDYYIVNDGILTKKDFTILFENEEKKVYIPVETTNSINVYSNVEMTSNFFEVLNRYNLNLNVYNQYGVYQGSFYTDNQRNRMKCLIKQVEIYQDEKRRLEYAKKMDMASLHNLRCNLKYYQCFNEMIYDKSFHFFKRTKRPPQDEINAMISFGNVYLYQKIAQMIYKTSVDIRISFVHSAMKRYENLNLDIADIFKPIIVDRVICTLINKKMISVKKHFQKEEDGGVFLNQEGKKILLQELGRKMRQVITVDRKTYTYERLIYQEIRNLEKSLLEGSKYKAFKYQM